MGLQRLHLSMYWSVLFCSSVSLSASPCPSPLHFSLCLSIVPWFIPIHLRRQGLTHQDTCYQEENKNVSGHLKNSHIVSHIEGDSLSITFFPSFAFAYYLQWMTLKNSIILNKKKNFWRKISGNYGFFQFKSPFCRSLWSAGFGGRLVSYRVVELRHAGHIGGAY